MMNSVQFAGCCPSFGNGASGGPSSSGGPGLQSPMAQMPSAAPSGGAGGNMAGAPGPQQGQLAFRGSFKTLNAPGHAHNDPAHTHNSRQLNKFNRMA